MFDTKVIGDEESLYDRVDRSTCSVCRRPYWVTATRRLYYCCPNPACEVEYGLKTRLLFGNQEFQSILLTEKTEDGDR
jgi:hypothetical protein